MGKPVALRDLTNKEFQALDSGDLAGLSNDEFLRVEEVGKRMQALKRSKANIRKDQESYNPTAGMSTGQKVLAGIGAEMSSLGRGARQLNERIGEAVSPHPGMQAAHAANRAELERRDAMARQTDAPLNATGAGKVGRVIGGIAATAPLGPLGVVGRGASVAKVAGAGARQGAATGAIMPATSDAERLKNVGIGAGLGAAIPAGIGGAGRLASRSPVLNDTGRAMQRLQDQGVVLTRADTLRNPAAQQVARLGRDSLSGQMARRGGEARRNASIARAVLRHIGEDADSATPEVLTRARSRIGREFEDVFSPDLKVQQTPDLLRTRADVLKNLPHSPGSRDAVLAEVKRVRESFQNGRTTGRTIKELTAHLRRRSESARKGQAIDAADAYDDLIEGLEEAAFNAAGPETQKRIATARRQWRNLQAIERAADRDWGGGISPRKLAQRLSTGKYTRNAYQRADKGSLEELARDLDTIADKLPDSGTPRGIISASEQGAALAAPFSGGASLLPSAVNALTQRGLASRAPRVGAQSAGRRMLGRSLSNTKAAPAANVAALAPLIEAMRTNDPELAALLGPQIVSQLRAAGVSPEDVTEDELQAMFTQPAGR